MLAVARALARGYTQAQVEPEEAVNAMTEADPELDREQLSTELDDAAATWTAGAKFFGELAPGPGRDPSVSRDASWRMGGGVVATPAEPDSADTPPTCTR